MVSLERVILTSYVELAANPDDGLEPRANRVSRAGLIKHILGSLRAESGTVRVFGLDPVSDPVSVLGRIGYRCCRPAPSPFQIAL
jgi:hypothetical protein